MKNLLIITAILIGISGNAQDTSDVHRLKGMKYMKYSHPLISHSEDNSALEQRIYKNLEFQKTDSIMNLKFIQLLSNEKSDRRKAQMKQDQMTWVENRRHQSEQNSNGYRGHHLGIIYLSTMVEMTIKRTRELEELLMK